MAQTKFTKDHEYISIDGEIGTIGITAHAQEKLGDVTYVEVPTVGKTFTKGDAAGVVESVKAASEVYSPVSGVVTEINDDLGDNPETVNSDPEGKAWFFKIKLSNASELNDLMDKAAYEKYTEEQH